MSEWNVAMRPFRTLALLTLLGLGAPLVVGDYVDNSIVYGPPNYPGPIHHQPYHVEHYKPHHHHPEPVIKRLRSTDYVSFYLYPNKHDWEYEERIITDDVHSLQRSHFNVSLPTTFLIHGQISDRHTLTDVVQIKNAYLQAHYPTNIIIADYGKLTKSKLPFLFSSLAVVTRILPTAMLTGPLVDEMTDFLLFMMRCGYLRPEDLHMVGFSQGGILNRRIGAKLYDLTGQRTKRITCLEGAAEWPWTAKINRGKRYTDFLEATITSQGILSHADMTKWDAIFYINGGGFNQPSCPTLFPFAQPYCGHQSSAAYYARSIRRTDMTACRCETVCFRAPTHCYDPVPWGQYLPPSTRGRYHVKLI